ncbi:hypothetical protein DACRYDRAFT_115523 [Dacryopinax primogenitus]|uniref:DASH complex subunit DAM1 n=1 Tax=Dacryopinax primogenitus (strain DJM 731) TaxID=1858805 RepID=M5FZ72_DACPD|nr:uncharacterized protein DACRYDRAFT_115523 [Dacryopinax primogenitus]EJU03341.1 hypothetical protein DACRYDRAFT_115523 [Dacryopinax primogenitus]
MAPPTSRTPLRRVSQSSLRDLHRSSLSQAHPAPTTALDFLAPVLSDLTDEADALQHNLEQLNGLYDALGTFNEAFASYLYALRMNAFCVEWQQAPSEDSFVRAKEAATRAAAALARQAHHPSSPTKDPPHGLSDKTRTTADNGNTTYATTVGSPNVSEVKIGIPKPGLKKRAPAKKMSPAEKKKRDADIEKIVVVMPIEYRGNDPDTRKLMEGVINKLMDAPNGLKIAELVKAPDLTQARVNKCLIALVSKKIVRKTSQNGAAMYIFTGVPP